MRNLNVLILALALSAHRVSSGASGVEPTETSSKGGETSARRVTGGRHAAEQAVASADRTQEERALDAGRHPVETFAFFGIEPGMDVVDVFAGGGHTTEILARIVGPEGSVVVQSNAWVLDRFARAPLQARLERLAMPNVTALEAELDRPVPQGAHDLDAVIFILSHHDSVWVNADRAAMNSAIRSGLTMGGALFAVDGDPGGAMFTTDSVPRGIRTLVATVKGWSPGPLDDGDSMDR